MLGGKRNHVLRQLAFQTSIPRVPGNAIVCISPRPYSTGWLVTEGNSGYGEMGALAIALQVEPPNEQS